MATVLVSCMYSFGTEKIERLFTTIKDKIKDFKWLFFIYIILVGLLSINRTDLWLLFHFMIIGLAVLVLFSVSEISLNEISNYWDGIKGQRELIMKMSAPKQ